MKKSTGRLKRRTGLWLVPTIVVLFIGGCGQQGPKPSEEVEPESATDTVGLFFTLNSRVILALDNGSEPAERRFNFGKRNPAWNNNLKPFAGDFLGNGYSNVGLYIRRQSRFVIHTRNVPGWPDNDFDFEPIPGVGQNPAIPLHPVIGDWDGDGADGIGLYRRDTGEFFLRNENSPGPPDFTFSFGAENSIPVAGDWDGDGADTIGVYNPVTGQFELAEANRTGAECKTFTFGAGKVYPLAGDWDGDGMDSVGLYEEEANLFHLKNSHEGGDDDLTLQLGGSDLYPAFPSQSGIRSSPLRFPMAGHWNTRGDLRADVPYDWEKATPASQEIDQDGLAGAYDHARTSPHLHSLLVIRNGKLVGEEYFNGFDAAVPNSIKSCTKVFTSALVGIAIEQGYLKDVNELVMDHLPDYITPGSHSWKQRLSIHHLLNMRAGFIWDNPTWNPQMTPTSNWVKYYLDRPMEAPPGDTFQYASGCPNTVATIVHRAVGKHLDKFAEEVLFGPLGITATRWDYEPNRGRLTFGPCELFMRPRDMARMGELYLNKGLLYGRQIVPAQWVEYSLTDHGDSYRNYWWHHHEGGYLSIAAQGYAGQRIYVTPELNLVVVTTSRWLVDGATAKEQQNDNFNLWRNLVLPSVKPSGRLP